MMFYSLMLNLNLKEGQRFLLESIRKKVINKNGKLEIQDLKKLFKKKKFSKKSSSGKNQRTAIKNNRNVYNKNGNKKGNE